MLQHIMEVTDSMGAAFSIETRCPFLDRRLIEFSLAIPSEQKLSDGWTRLIQRKAMEGILPPKVQWRLYKADLGYNFVFSLRGRDRQMLLESLFDEPEVLADYVDMDELRNIHQSFDSNGLKGARDSSARLYIAAVLARWLRGWQSGSASEPEGLPT
jgi:asparagine synthase (glutamine-hydrolysing)